MTAQSHYRLPWTTKLIHALVLLFCESKKRKKQKIYLPVVVWLRLRKAVEQWAYTEETQKRTKNRQKGEKLRVYKAVAYASREGLGEFKPPVAHTEKNFRRKL